LPNIKVRARCAPHILVTDYWAARGPPNTTYITSIVAFTITNGAEIRHDCTQSDQLDTYTWTEHDVRQGGVEIIKDDTNNVELKIEWIKVPGGINGGSWAARISGKPMKPGTVQPDSIPIKPN